MNLSILITTYNCGNFIKSSIMSVLNQTHKCFELLVIDDGSNDNTEIIIKNFQDKRIKYIKIDHIGRSKALNYGLREAKYNWIALMDADDIWHPQKIERQLNNFSFKKNEIIATWSAYFKQKTILYTVDTPLDVRELKEKMALHSFICNPSVIYNKNFVLENGGYDENLTRFEDYDFWLKALNKISFTIIPEYLVFMRIRVSSSSNENKSVTRKIVYELQEKYSDEKKNNLYSLNQAEKLRLKGWREYFYGNKIKVRSNWININLFTWDYRMCLAFVLTFFPSYILNIIREYRLRIRLKTFIHRLTNKYWLPEKFLREFLLSEKD